MLHPNDPRRLLSATRRRRRHASPHTDDRAMLERSGWRTTLDYRENHRRDADGVLAAVETRWRGDAERSGSDGAVIVFSAVGSTPTAVWRRLRVEAERGEREALTSTYAAC